MSKPPGALYNTNGRLDRYASRGTRTNVICKDSVTRESPIDTIINTAGTEENKNAPTMDSNKRPYVTLS